jgi:uncharacterized protein YbjQ (UPF0145 family)
MNEYLALILTFTGWVVVAVVFGRAIAHGLANGLKNSVPKWIHDYVKETTEARVVANARNKMDEYNELS